ncbi:hypothetical protein COCOBI_08-6140 [Coccomyxa sp. Obi]|nr:hypothetical protein COCOBI_08-6140 [Coccomyxa sp. Obi]
MDDYNYFDMRKSPLNIPYLDEWAADYLVKTRETVENNCPYMVTFKPLLWEGTVFGAPDAPTASQQQTQEVGNVLLPILMYTFTPLRAPFRPLGSSPGNLGDEDSILLLLAACQASFSDAHEAVYGVNLTREERVALVQQIPPSLMHDTLAVLEREAQYEQLPPEQRLSARQRPYPPEVFAALLHAFTRQEKQQSSSFKLHQDASHRQQCTHVAQRPTKTNTVHQPHLKRPHPAGLDIARAGIWVCGLSKLATINEIWTAFSVFGEVVDVSKPKDWGELHKCRWTFVNFASPESSNAALMICQHAATDMSLYHWQMMQGIKCIMADPSLPLEVRRRLPPF